MVDPGRGAPSSVRYGPMRAIESVLAVPTRQALPVPPDRKAKRPGTHLAGFKGTLQLDGYRGYRMLNRARGCAARLLLVPCAAPLLRTRRTPDGADRSEALEHIAALRAVFPFIP